MFIVIFCKKIMQWMGSSLLHRSDGGNVRPDVKCPNNSPEQGPDFYWEGLGVTSVITLPTHPLGICICSIAANVAAMSVI